jgi:hypothetical protein
MSSMTVDKEEKIMQFVDAGGKSAERIKSSERTFATFRLYALSQNVDPESGTSVELPRVIAAWLGLLAGIGAEEGDVSQLATVISTYLILLKRIIYKRSNVGLHNRQPKNTAFFILQ